MEQQHPDPRREGNYEVRDDENVFERNEEIVEQDFDPMVENIEQVVFENCASRSERSEMRRERLRNETEEERRERLAEERQRRQLRRLNETDEERETRLAKQREYSKRHRERVREAVCAQSSSVEDEFVFPRQETREERDSRLNRYRISRQIRLNEETADQRASRLALHRVSSQRDRDLFDSDDIDCRRVVESDRHFVRARAQLAPFFKLGYNYDPNSDYSQHQLISIGVMDQICPHCCARRFPGEKNTGMCCGKGQVRFDPFPPPPDPYFTHFFGDHHEGKEFRRDILKYNACFRMTSLGASGRLINEWSTTTVHGQIYHLIGSLLPVPESQPGFLQIWFSGDKDTQVSLRHHINNTLNRRTIESFQVLLNANNRLINQFKIAMEQMPSDNHRLVIRADKPEPGEHRGCYNAPVEGDIAVIIVDHGTPGHRDIVLKRRDDSLERVRETNQYYDALQYPLIFWRGDSTYHFDMSQNGPSANVSRKVTSLMFYSYHFMIRTNNPNYLFRCGQLMNQFVVDMYAKIESERLNYFRTHQSHLRAAEYIDLRDAMNNDGDLDNLGRRVILPSSFTGGPRHMHEYAQDAMTYVREFGRPALFITFTCNPRWPEITASIMPGQESSHRHDIYARVFNEKVKVLTHLLTKGELFGAARCLMYSIEWQKRGLPHAHILLWLRETIRPHEIDNVISAELPDPQEDPVLFEIIKTSMIHRPCGLGCPKTKCIKDRGRGCINGYPRQLLNETKSGTDGYPLYKRRSVADGGSSFIQQSGEWKDYLIDNRWVVPHNRFLCKTFNAHINVEYCYSVKSIKYICKYVYKGSDMASMEVHPIDKENEIDLYLTGRYISTNEAFWRIFKFDIHHRTLSVEHLQVHLENGARVYYTPANVAQRAIERPKTTLTEFFALCNHDEFARTLLYVDMPKYYRWIKDGKRWQKRVRGRPVTGYDAVTGDQLGRVYAVHHKHTECFYLRVLLMEVRGPTSFEYLKSVDGTLYGTFKEACQARGLLESDSEWKETLKDAVTTKSPYQIRSLFASIVSQYDPSDPAKLWDLFKDDMSEDILHRRRLETQDPTLDYDQSVYNSALIMIEDICLDCSGKVLSQLGLPSPERPSNDANNREIDRERRFNCERIHRYVTDNLPKLFPDQSTAFWAIINSVKNKSGGLFFLDAPGGTGKTFVTNLILAYLRSEGSIALATASSGIAATLLEGGRTAHSLFKLPLDMRGPVSCAINRGTSRASLLEKCDLIVLDECTMMNKKAFEAIDECLRDVRRQNSLMGGVVFLLTGDFRQTLPVIEKSTPADEIEACLKNSRLWPHVQKLSLSTNMRVLLGGDPNSGTFAEKLLTIGNGTIDCLNSGEVPLEQDLCCFIQNQDQLIEKVFPNLQSNLNDMDWVCERAILAPTNVAVNEINTKIQDKLSSLEPRIYKSIDRTVEEDQQVEYPIEFLNTLSVPGFPPHELILKKGSPIMILRNLRPPIMCNGTRLRIDSLMDRIIQATIITGPYKGDQVLIPRCPLISDHLFLQFKRLQFPIKLAFAFTVNKAQGQTLKVAGLDFSSEPVFSHGQFYVACSRVGTPSNLFITAPKPRTRNIVYPQVLQG